MNRILPLLIDAAHRFADNIAFCTRRMNPLLRRLLLGSAMLAAAIALTSPAASATEHWRGSWGMAPAGPPPPSTMKVFSKQTLRLIVHTSAGGNRVRIRLSNEMGSVPLRIGAARIGLRAGGSSVAPGTDRALSFGGRPWVDIAPGAPVLSDPVELHVPPLSDLAVSLYLPDRVEASTVHLLASQAGYVSPPGDFSASPDLPVQRTVALWPFLTGVEVDGAGPAIVILGDSVTDGVSGNGSGGRWTDWLARRLQGARDPVDSSGARPSVVNRGLAGNRLLSNAPNPLSGRSALERFDRDVLATSGVRYLLLLIGIQDIGASSPTNPVTLEDMVAGYRQLIARARARGVNVIGGTLPPFEGTGGYSPQKEQLRQAVNAWIRHHDEFDAFIDFDRVLRDPARPSRLLPAYDSGDHLHPNELGHQAMANEPPLSLFRNTATRPVRAR